MEDRRNIRTVEERSDEKIRRHRRAPLYSILLIVVVVLILVLVVSLLYTNRVYTAYNIVEYGEFSRIEDSKLVTLGENILTYSHDGAYCTDKDGKVLWNQTFEMQNILVSINGDVVAFADYNGKNIYVWNSSKKINEVTTTMPIKNIAVAETGRVAASVADTAVTWIYIYDKDGKQAYEIKTTMEQSGYPLDFSFSPNGELLGLVCVYVDSDVIKSQVAFHNFGAVGSNMSDYKVSADIYPDTVIPYIEFINDDTAIAVGDNRVLMYSGNQKPVLKSNHMIDERIQAVYHNEEYVGVLLPSDVPEHLYKLMVLKKNKDDDKFGDFYLDDNYNDLFFTEDYFVAYNNSECVVQSYKGITKFDGDFLSSADLLIPIGNGKSYRYIMVTRDNISTIQLE